MQAGIKRAIDLGERAAAADAVEKAKMAALLQVHAGVRARGYAAALLNSLLLCVHAPAVLVFSCAC